MTNETRTALLSSLLTHLEASCDLLRALIAHDVCEGPPLPAPAEMQTSVPTQAETGCAHPEEKRCDVTTLGSPVRRELCGVCGAELENGKAPGVAQAEAGH